MRIILLFFVLLSACAKVHASTSLIDQSTSQNQKSDVMYSYKKQIYCVDVPLSVTQSYNFNPDSGRFFVDNHVIPAHQDCTFVDISVCGTLTN